MHSFIFPIVYLLYKLLCIFDWSLLNVMCIAYAGLIFYSHMGSTFMMASIYLEGRFGPIKLGYLRNLLLVVPGQMSGHAFWVRGIDFSYFYDSYIGFWNWEWPNASANENMKTVLCMLPWIRLDKKVICIYHIIIYSWHRVSHM
jgi:hypothetical protein